MQILGYLLFAFVSWPLLMGVFRYSTYHRFAAWAVPLVLGFGALSGACLNWFGLAPFFLWHLLLFGVLLVSTGWKTWKSARDLRLLMNSDEDGSGVTAMSGNLTVAMYTISSIAYLAGFGVSFLLVYNMRASE